MAARIVDITGLKFGKLKVLGMVKSKKTKPLYWDCVCECGNRKVANGDSLKRGQTKSCGCYRSEKITKSNFKHGHCNRSSGPSKEFKAWKSMKARCKNEGNIGYKRYGGRGIYICKEWRESFQSFLDDMGEVPEGHSLDRIDNDGPYSPENCRWADKKTQGRNRSNVREIMFLGKVYMGRNHLADETGISEWKIERYFKKNQISVLEIQYAELLSKK